MLIVSYNTLALTRACLQSIFAETKDLPFEVIVVDNASADGSSSMIANEFPTVTLISSDTNQGFARATNLAAAHSQGDWLLLLNPDTVILERAIEKIHRFAETYRGAALFGGRTLDAGGRIDPTCCWARPTPWSVLATALGLNHLPVGSPMFHREAMKGWRRDSMREVDIITGCFLLIHRDHWRALDGFDPAFFLYGEEADLCLRAAQIGLRCVFFPGAEIIHYGGQANQSSADKIVRLFCAKSLLFQKHWTALGATFGRFCLDAWAATRFLAYKSFDTLSGRYHHEAATWQAVLRRRKSWHRLGI